jgi:broad specificity phosphatase PhoE
MEVLLIRHGAKLANPRKEGPDESVGLSEIGKAEVRTLARQLNHYLQSNYPNLSTDDVAIYFSPLPRTVQTKTMLQHYSHPALHHCQSVRADYLREKQKGLGAIYSEETLRKIYPTLMEQLYDSHSDSITGRMTRKYPGAGAQSVMDQIAQHNDTIRADIAAAETAGKKLVIMVGHSCTSRMMAGALCFNGNIKKMNNTFLQDTWDLQTASVLSLNGNLQTGFSYTGLLDLGRTTSLQRSA